MQEVTHTLPTWEALRAHFGTRDPHSVVGMLVIREQQEGRLRLFTLRFFWKPEGRDIGFGHMLSRFDFQMVGAPLGLLRDLWGMPITEKPKPLRAGHLCWFLEAFLVLVPNLFPFSEKKERGE